MIQKNRGGARRARRQVAQLTVTLLETERPVWRRILVPHDIPLRLLHRVLTVAMGWQGYHLHAFEADGERFGEPDRDFPDRTIPEDRVALRGIARVVGSTFTYEYDFGDDWQHLVTLERLLPFGPDLIVPRCLDGAGACPHEDVGGVSGYARLVGVIEGGDRPVPGNGNEPPEEMNYDDGTPASYRRWLGFDFDPDELHVRCINMEFRRLLAFDEEFQALLPIS